MKKDYYFPHEIRTRNDEAVMELIECEGASGYGIYWALMEYLRTQEGYVGKMIAVKTIARQMRTKAHKVDSVLRNYELFVIEGNTFRSVRLEKVMRPLDEKRTAMEARNERNAKAKQEQCVNSAGATSEQKSDNSLKTNDDVSLSKVKESKEEESKEEKRITSSSKEDGNGVGDGVGVSSSIAWERYVDGLAKEQQWIEIMAMRSGLGKAFVQRFPEVLKHFKLHVQAVGGENRIRSLSDAKLYFNNFNKPGSTPFVRLVEELRKPVDKGKYRYEDRHPDMGPRSYCGVPIPPEAPPRPNNQAVWCRGKWRY